MGWFTKHAQSEDLRLEALNMEYQNYRRRTSLELEQAGDLAARKTAQAFLCLYDDLQRALSMPCGDPAFYKGIQLIQRNLMDTFSSLGICPMDSKGKIFNPVYHEAVDHIIDPQYREEEITEVIQVGFTMHEEVLRHARVVVANCR